MDKLNEDFKKTCKLLFGEEIGELAEFSPYLAEALFPCRMAKSSVSGKPMMMSSHLYSEKAAYAAQDEISIAPSKPFSINDIKDIDSLFRAASERAVFCGNKVFGRNMNVTESDNIVDSIEVLRSHDVYNSKYAAYCSIGRFSESIYGVSDFWNCSHAMRSVACFVKGAIRSFECYYSTGISDSYYTSNCSACTNCMFSFNLRNKHFAIGNLVLPKDRYLALRQKLVSEMAEKLKKGKRIFSLADLSTMGTGTSEDVRLPPSIVPLEVEKAFSSTTKIVLGKERQGSHRYADWLLKNTISKKKVKGAFGSPTYKVDLPLLGKIPGSRLAPIDEALTSSAQHIQIADGESLSLDETARRASKIAVFTFELRDGMAQNTVDTAAASDATNTYLLWWTRAASYAAYSTLVTESKYIFGGYARVLNSEFCINCYNVTNVKNCFETDSSYQCRNCYFCHNCENVEEGILCFNAKGLRYAVLNTQVPKEEYLRIKKILLDYVNKELDAKGKLDFDIFSIGAKKKEMKK